MWSIDRNFQDLPFLVYKINPRPPQYGYSPTFKPYLPDDSAYRTSVYPSTPTDWIANFATEGTNRQFYDGYNLNIEPYTVFDSHGGIYIDNWGFDENNWEDNLWDILGFDYNVVNATATSTRMRLVLLLRYCDVRTRFRRARGTR